MNLSNYFGNRSFYKKVMAIAVPIMVQNGITNFVNMIDNIMVGSVGTEQMSAVAIVNKLIFVFNLCLFGGCAGVGIFTAQYYGKGDYKGVKRSFRLKFLTNSLLLIIAISIFSLFGDKLISLYLHESENTGNIELAFKFAKQYLTIIMLGLIPQAISECYSSTLRETEHTRLPMIAGMCAVITNVSLNYILIFGKLGLPAMGVKGAAIATVVSKFVELLVLLSVTKIKSTYSYLHGAFRTLRVPLSFVKMVLPKSIPLLLNEAGWGTGVAALTYCYSLKGIDVVAGYSISSTISDIFNIAMLALGNAIAIMVGNLLGANKMEEAKRTTARLITFSVLLSVVLCVVLYVTAPLFPMLYKETSLAAKDLAASFLRIYAIYLIFNTFICSCYFTIRSGGNTLITFLFDSVFMLCIAFPFTFILAKFTNLTIMPIYALSLGIEFIKVIAGALLLKSGKWMKNIVD